MLRGPKETCECSARKVENNIRKVAATPLGRRTTIAMQVAAGHTKYLYDNVMSAFSLGITNVALNKVVDSYTIYSEEDFAELEEQFSLLSRFISVEKMKGGERKIQFFEKRLSHLCSPAACGGDGINTCGAAKGSLSVAPDGAIYPCQRLHLERFRLGSVFEGIDAEKRKEFLKARFQQCDRCEVKPCAPCFATNLLREGDMLKIPRENCKYEHVLFRKTLALSSLLTRMHLLRQLAAKVPDFTGEPPFRVLRESERIVMFSLRCISPRTKLRESCTP